MIIFSQLGRYGRFGNALYQVAGVIGVARKSGQPYGFPKFINHDHKERFGSSENIEIFNELAVDLPGLIQGVNYTSRFIQWGYHDITLPSGNWDLIGHLQSPKYFKHCINEVKEALRFKNEPPLNDYCAIHWRAGDYQDGENAYHPRQTFEYYRKAIEHIPEGTRFMIFSDDVDAAKAMFSDLDAVYPSQNYIEDYKLMKSCRHFIISNSSFSAFAATVSDQKGVVVAPRKWFGTIAGITGDDIYDEDWIVI